MLNKIIISGSIYSGKQTLLHLLDGHPDLKVNTIHDKIINSLIYLNNLKENDFNMNNANTKSINVLFDKTKKRKKLNETILKEALEQSAVRSVLKSYAEKKKMFDSYSGIERSFYEFDFNFEKFIKNFYKDLLIEQKKKEISSEEFLDIYLINFFKEQSKQNFIDTEKTKFAFKSPNDLKSIEFILKEDFNCKIIFVDRDILGILKSRSINYINIRDKEYSLPTELRAKEGKNKKDSDYRMLNKVFEQITNSEFVDKLKKYTNNIYSLRSNYPDKLYITTLEKIVYKTNGEIENILNFLKIDKNSICYYPSYLGKKVNSDHIKKINDDELDIKSNLQNFLYFRFYGLKFILKNLKNVKLNTYIKIFIFYIKTPFKFLLKLFSEKDFAK